MDKSLCERFLDEMRPWSTFTSHIQPSPEIWFETKNFVILGFFGPWAQGSDCSPLEIEINLEHNSHGFWKFYKLNWNPSKDMNKTEKSF